jgi:diguanylate cyclase (GGDEF)-like protein
VRLLVARAEPLLVIGLGGFLASRATQWGREYSLISIGVGLLLFGFVGVVGRNHHRVVEVRLWCGLIAACTVALIDSDYALDMLAWFAIFGLGPPIALGLKRASASLTVASLAMLIGSWSVFNVYAGLIRGSAVLLGGVLFGMIADSFEESDAVARTARREARRATRREQQLRTVLDAAPIGIIVMGDSEANSFFSREIAAVTTRDIDPRDLTFAMNLLHEDDRWIITDVINSIVAGNECTHICRLLHPELGERLVRVIGAPSMDSDGKLIGSVIIVVDIDDDVRQRRAIERFRAAADVSPDLVCIESIRGEPRYLNAAASTFWTGLTHLPADDAFRFVADEHREVLRVGATAAIAADVPWTGEIELIDYLGNRHPFSAVVVGIRDDSGLLLGWATTYHALTERRQLERRLAYQAGHDALTGLPNRHQLFNHIEQQLQDRQVTVLFCDLDDFKIINDSLGHSVGDSVLATVAQRFNSVVADNELVGRLGGDEFLVVCDHLDADAARAVAQRFIEAARRPISVEGRDYIISMSVGIASSHAGAADAGQLMQEADLAMYSAKRSGRGKITLYDDQMRVNNDERLTVERELRSAFALGQFDLRYEPVVCVAHRDVVIVEALVRWNHPTRGLVSPGQFLPTVSAMGLDDALGAFVLQTATKALAELQRVDPKVVMSINFSAAQLQDHRIVDRVAEAIEAAGVAPSTLMIEITEEIVMADVLQATPKLDALRKLGVRLAIDDFGTGYSNLAMLRSFPANYVKIDRSLIDGLGEDPGDTQMVRLILSLTKELGFEPIAEGVETEAQLQALAPLDCRLVQGWLIARSMTLDEMKRFLERNLV